MLQKLSENFVKNNCPIFIFYEAHDDALPAKTLESLLAYLKEKGIGIYFSEDPHDESQETFVQTIINGLPYFTQALINPEFLQEMRDSTGNSMIDLQSYKISVQNQLNSFEAALRLMNTVSKLALKYVGVDLNRQEREILVQSSSDHVKIRNKRMVAKISETCRKYQTGAALLVGLGHLEMESMLRDLGFNVISFYIPSHPRKISQDNQDLGADFELRIRDNDRRFAQKHEHSINVIDVHENPMLDPVDLSKSLIEDFVAKSKKHCKDEVKSPILKENENRGIGIVQRAIAEAHKSSVVDFLMLKGATPIAPVATSTTSLSSHQRTRMYCCKAIIIGICAVVAAIYFATSTSQNSFDMASSR